MIDSHMLKRLGIVCVIILVCMGIITIQQTSHSSKAEPLKYEDKSYILPSITQDAEIEIIFRDDIPTAVLSSTKNISPTNTPVPTFTPTPTNTPTPTLEPTPTNTPTPTPTVVVKASYKYGSAGTRKCEINGTHTWKPWANYTAITAKNSPQWRLQQIATTDELGRRVVKDPNGVTRFCVALPVYWAGGTYKDIGRCFDVKMVNGAVLHCCLGDTKKIEHSLNGEGKYGRKGEILEVQCDGEKLIFAVKNSGNCSNFSDEWKGEVESITAFDIFIDGVQ